MVDILDYIQNNTLEFIIDIALIVILVLIGIILILKKWNKKYLLIYLGMLLMGFLCFFFELKILPFMLAATVVTILVIFLAGGEFSFGKQKDQSALFAQKVNNAISSEEAKEKLIDTLVETIEYFSSRKIGAILTFEKNNSLNSYIEKAVKIDAVITSELLKTIFFPNTALHDGAVIIRGERIICAAAFYRPAEQADIPSNYGSRHRAAIGISEDSDAFTIVVSEESGTISSTLGGTITAGLSEESLRASLNQHLKVE